MGSEHLFYLVCIPAVCLLVTLLRAHGEQTKQLLRHTTWLLTGSKIGSKPLNLKQLAPTFIVIIQTQDPFLNGVLGL